MSKSKLAFSDLNTTETSRGHPKKSSYLLQPTLSAQVVGKLHFLPAHIVGKLSFFTLWPTLSENLYEKSFQVRKLVRKLCIYNINDCKFFPVYFFLLLNKLYCTVLYNCTSLFFASTHVVCCWGFNMAITLIYILATLSLAFAVLPESPGDKQYQSKVSLIIIISTSQW